MSLKGLFQQVGRYAVMAVATCLPLAGFGIPKDSPIVFVFPPLGGLNNLLEPGASLLIVASGVLALHQSKRRSPSAKFRRGFLIGLICFAVCITLVMTLVVRIDYPDHTYQYRLVGIWRTELGRENPELKNAPAALAIKIVGTEEEAIETVWEPWSIFLARILLFTSFVATLGSLNFAFGALKLGTSDAGSPVSMNRH
jgi:hypothetical protein